jgi:NAD(P)-dependent dehydrogenase (short-subunit alcohol dehydrogenase family)
MKGVVVTGAAQGIGRAIAARLVEEGWQVAGLDVLPATLDIPWVVGDVADAEAHRQAISLLPSLDAYVNNAGIISRTALVDTTDEDFDRVIDVNLRGVFLGMREAAKTFLRQNSPGHIVSLSSGHAILAGYDRAPYAATKAGIEALTRNAAAELGPHRILVNAVAPGFTFTEMSRGSLVGERLKFVEKRLPLGRVSEAEEVAKSVACLLSGALSGMTGQVLRVDGGWSNSDIRYLDWKPIDRD